MKKDLVKTVKIISSFLVLTMGLSGCTLPESSVSEPQVEVHFADEIEPPTLLGQYPVEPQEDEFLDEVPEYISNRGVILMGGYQQGASALFRKSPDGNLELARNYYNNCNLRVESSFEELVAFSEHFSDFGTPMYDEDGTFASFSRPKYAFAIYRSDIYSMTELVQTLGDPMFELFPAFYDPSGKFIFVWETGFTYDDVMLPVLLKFLEPEMTEVKYERNGLGDGVEAIVTAPEDIDAFLDVMHSLELSLETEDHSVLAMAENRDVLTFTDINGKVNYYIFIGNYLIHGEDVYWIENSEKLDELEMLFDSAK